MERNDRILLTALVAIATSLFSMPFIAVIAQKADPATVGAIVSALATVVVAWFTITLANATRGLQRASEKQAKDLEESLGVARASADAARESAIAAKQSADAALGVELAQFVVEAVTFDTDDDLAYRVEFKNYGRTPALITRTYMTAQLDGPAIPLRYPGLFQLQQQLPLQKPVLPNGIFSISREFGQLLDNLKSSTGGADNRPVWVYGYFDWIDFMKREHREGFCLASRPVRFMIGKDDWVIEGPPQYTFSRYKIDAEIGTISGSDRETGSKKPIKSGGERG